MTIYAQIEKPAISGMMRIRERTRVRLSAGRAFDAVVGYSDAQSDLESLAASREILDATKDLAAALSEMSGSIGFSAVEDYAVSHGISMISVENGGRGGIDEVSVSDDDGAYIVAVTVIGLCRIEANLSSKRHAREIYVQGILALAADLEASR